MKLVELNYIWVFIFSTNSMYCEMWSEKHSFPGCLSWNPTRMVTSEQCGGCPDTAKCHPGAECHLSEKTSDVFLRCFFAFSWLLKGVKESTNNNYQQKNRYVGIMKSPMFHGTTNHRHSRSITRFTARKTEELNQATTKNRASRSFKFGMTL